MSEFGQIKEPNTVYVWFRHDLEDSWDYAEFPDKKYNGDYNFPLSIKEIAIKHNWKIEYNRLDTYSVFVI